MTSRGPWQIRIAREAIVAVLWICLVIELDIRNLSKKRTSHVPTHKCQPAAQEPSITKASQKEEGDLTIAGDDQPFTGLGDVAAVHVG